MAESRVGNSENPNGLRIILGQFCENDSKIIKIHQVYKVFYLPIPVTRNHYITNGFPRLPEIRNWQR